MSQHHYGRPLEVNVENGALVIRLGAQTLAHAVSYADWANPFDEDRHDYIRTFAITDAQTFAKDVVHAMQREREDGSTPVSDFLDAMTRAAVDDGSEACEYEQRIPHGTTAPSETWASQSSQEPPVIARDLLAELRKHIGLALADALDARDGHLEAQYRQWRTDLEEIDEKLKVGEAPPAGETPEPKTCVHGHTAYTVGCVSCVLLHRPPQEP